MKFKYLIVLIAIASLVALYFLSLVSQPVLISLSALPTYNGQQVIVQGVVIEYRTTTYDSQIITIRDVENSTNSVTIFIEGEISVEYGDTVQAIGEVQQYKEQWEVSVNNPHSVTILKFDNGVIGKCAASVDYRGPYYFPFEIQGEAGCIRDNQFYSTKLGGQKGMAAIPTIMLDSGDVTHHPYEDEINDFVSCLLENRAHSIDLEHAARTHEVIFAADRAAAEGRVVKMAEIEAE